MSPRRRFIQRSKVVGRHYAFAECSDAEYAVLKAQADKAGLRISDYVRRCINSVWLEEGDDIPLLEERGKSAIDEANGAYE